MKPKYDIEVQLNDGNAFAIMGAVSRALRKAGAPEEEIDKYREESASGNYGNVLQTATKWVNVIL